MITFEDIFECAKQYNCDNVTEAQIRVGIHSAYYAAYHAALAFAEQQGFSMDNGVSTHRQLRDYFLKHENRAMRAIGRKLSSAFQLRCDADYEIHKTINKSILITQLNNCRQCLNDLKRLQNLLNGNTP